MKCLLLMENSSYFPSENAFGGRTVKTTESPPLRRWPVAQLFALSLCCAAWPLSIRTTVLPRDMHEAEIMLREGSLDSLEWDLLQPYYVAPINVPQGELALLCDLFDMRLGNLPVSQEQLSVYQPWDAAARDRFFADYPELVKYEPILSFSRTGVRHAATAGMAVSADNRLRTTASSRFSVQPAAGVLMNGSIGHGDTADLWVKRSLSVSVPNILSIAAGNFAMAEDNGLFYGYFPSGSGPVTTFSNWKYAGSRAWNGLCVRSDRWNAARISAFYHERFTEQALGVFCDAGPSEALQVTTGVSRIAHGASDSMRPANDIYFHCGLSGSASGFDYSVNGGSAKSNPLAVPVTAQCGRKSGSASFSVLVARIPGGVALSRSKIAFDCRNELDMSDSAAWGDLTLADCRTSLALSRAFATSLSMSYIASQNREALAAGAGASGKGWVDYRVSYAYHMSTAAQQETHKASFSIERSLSRFVRPGILCDCYLTSAGFGSVRGRLPVAVSWPGVLLVTPYAEVYANTSQARSYTAGLKEELHISDRTWCNCDASTSLDQTNAQEWNINARAYFCF
jgi:hypothetical protein